MKSDSELQKHREELIAYYESDRDKLVKRFAYRAGGPENAEDVVQEAFTRGLQYISSYGPQHKSIQSWMNTILYNSCKDFNSQERHQGAIIQEDNVLDDLEMFVHNQELLEKLANEIQDMPNRDTQAVLIMFVFSGYTAKEVARVVDMNIHTVRKTIAEFYKYAREAYG